MQRLKSKNIILNGVRVWKIYLNDSYKILIIFNYLMSTSGPNKKTISLIESYFSGPSKDAHEVYRRIFKAKNEELIHLFTEKACKTN